MKLVKNSVFAGLLIFSIAVNIFAGEVQTPGIVSPQPTPTPSAVTAYDDGSSSLGYPCIDQTGDITADTTDYLFYEILAALLSVY